MAKKTVTLYIDDTGLRVMVAQGRQIRAWAESPLEPGLVENNVVTDEAEVARRIRQLLDVQKIKEKKISLGVSGFRCFTRPVILPKLPKEMLGEAVRREAQRVFPVPLEELYLSWQPIPAPEEQSQVFMVGMPRKMADALFKTMQRAGLKVGFMEIKPLLLARVVKQTAIIVDVQATDFHIVVMANGIPQPVRGARFASGTLSSEEKLTTIKNELNRIYAFLNSNNPEKDLAPRVPVFTGNNPEKALADPSVPVFASGDLASQPELCQSLSSQIGHPVLPLPPPMDYPDGFDPGHYMANIGLALPVTPSREKLGGAVITLNELPAVYETKTVSLANVIPIPSAVIAVGLLVFLVMFGQSVSGEIASLNAMLNKANQQTLQKQVQQRALSGKVAELQNSVTGAAASRDSLTRVLDDLEKQAQATQLDLTAAMENLPQSLNLSSVRHVANVLTVIGTATSENQILSYITKLDKSGQFGNIVITDMTRDVSGRIDFTVVGASQAKGIGATSIEVALGSLPTSVTLTSVSSAAGPLTIEGIAPESDRVFAYLRALEASGKFTEITVTSMTRTDRGTMKFALVLKMGG